jgi:hypothetical protein
VLQAVRSGKWKLHLGSPKGKKKKGSGRALFDLETDIAENKNVLAKHPDVEKRLLMLVKAFQAELAENSRPAAFVKNPKPLKMESSR